MISPVLRAADAPSRVVRAYDAKLDVSDGERSVVAVINTDAVDRYHTVIDPAGIDLAAYRLNPVVLWIHGCDAEHAMPVARNAWIKYVKADRTLVAKSIFFDDEFADRVFRLYQAQALRAFSVNVVPKPVAGSVGSPTSEEVRRRPELADCDWIYRQTELAEYSAVPVPGNGECLALAVSRGLWMPESLRAAAHDAVPGPILPDATAAPGAELPRLAGCRTLAQASAALVGDLRRRVPEAGRRAAQDRIDLLRGRV